MLPSLSLLLVSSWAGSADPSPADSFETTVRPILAASCIKCHGPRKQKGGLRLDSIAGILAGGELGPVVVPGNPDESRLIRAVRYTDDDLQMPPKEKLPDERIEELVRWIASGAPGLSVEHAEKIEHSLPAEGSFDLDARRAHWCYEPVGDPEAPAVRDVAWARTDIDAFLLARLEQEGLQPAPAADAYALVRRLSFDLTGLPPDPERADAYAADPSDDAYVELVDELLASPHFGERWAQHWLDLARYAETRGHEFDFDIPNAYEYRDYVVRALNTDVPYDRFVRELIAGDLLREPRPNPDGGWDESVLGTGFWFLGEQVHSPVDVRADEAERLAGQVDTFSKAVLAQTVACARCHDHKFDAISARDYYALCGFVLSSSYRQVRFETEEHNIALAGEIEESRARVAPGLRRETGEALLAALEGVEEPLAAATEVLRKGVLPPSEALPERIDLLIEDFEADDWGEWTVEGEDFGVGPTRRDEFPDHMRDVDPRGEGALSTYALRRADGTIDASDEHTGTLTSPAFTIERDWLHFLIGGGDRPGARIELLVDDEPVTYVVGFNSNRFRPFKIDVREYTDRSARLRVVDEHTAGWGQIALDHVVLSDRTGSDALDVKRRPASERGWHGRCAAEAERANVPIDEVRAWFDALDDASDDASSPLFLLTDLVDAARNGPSVAGRIAELRAEHPETRTRLSKWIDDAQMVFDPGRFDAPDSVQPWIVDGPTFGTRPVREAELLPIADPAAPLARLARFAAVAAEPIWRLLELNPSTQIERGRSLDQSGGMWRTRTFTLEHPRLYSLVRGGGRAYVAAASHRMNFGPLHWQLVRDFGTRGPWRFVEQDLEHYVGERVHVEFTPRGKELEVALVVAAATPPPEGALTVAPPAGFDGVETLADAAGEWTREARRVAVDLARDRLAPEQAGFAQGLIDLTTALGTLDVEGASALAWRDERERLAERVARVSRTAPALLDANRTDEFLLVRGNPSSPAGTVPRAFLEVLGGEPIRSADSGRLALAEEVCDPDNPLVARALVNRVWQHLFGRGIVATPDDFGRMGEPPSHPELLDFLARRFQEDGWSIKRLVRRLVTTSAYRMASRSTDEAERADPENRLLHRMPRKRLDAEALRDAILFVTGTLDATVGGPPVPLFIAETNTGRGRPEVQGAIDGAGRRSIYLASRRNFPSPFLAAFDKPVSASTVGRRDVSMQPAQALAMLNDPFVHQATLKWAESALERYAEDQRLQSMFRAALTRPPRPEEVELLLGFVDGQREVWSEIEEAAAEDDVRPWADLGHALLNTSEFLFVD